MSKPKQLTKVMKYELSYLDGAGDFRNMQGLCWGIQKQVRILLNRTLQIAYNWDCESDENVKNGGKPYSVYEKTGYKTVDTYICHKLHGEFGTMAACVYSATIRSQNTHQVATRAWGVGWRAWMGQNPCR